MSPRHGQPGLFSLICPSHALAHLSECTEMTLALGPAGPADTDRFESLTGRYLKGPAAASLVLSGTFRRQIRPFPVYT